MVVFCFVKKMHNTWTVFRNCCVRNVHSGNGRSPRLTITPPRLTTAVGGDATFRCLVVGSRGQANGKVQWQRADGRPLSSRAILVDNTLVFRQVQSTDEGRYICTASNRYGQTNVEAELIVSGTDGRWAWRVWRIYCVQYNSLPMCWIRWDLSEWTTRWLFVEGFDVRY